MFNKQVKNKLSELENRVEELENENRRLISAMEKYFNVSIEHEDYIYEKRVGAFSIHRLFSDPLDTEKEIRTRIVFIKNKK